MRKWLAYKLYQSIRKEVEATLREQIIVELKDEESKTRKEVWKANCEQVFVIDGKRYYRYTNADAIPLKRLEPLQQCIMALSYKLDLDELSLLIEIGQLAAQRAIESFKEKNRLDGIQTVGYVFEEMKSRKDDLMFNPDLLMQIAAYTIIREDEDPHQINDKIIQDKLKLFKERGGEVDFFTKAGLTSYLPRWEQLKAAWNRLWVLHQQGQERSKENYAKILTELKSESS